ncbi:hypothetical protein OA2633_04161 [Oceanicaulis sp. HTCC2633]|uniref:hypothetical protein n=1 Tax=Oceanicaulis sp. HTCC2633 TaxID=314254 RepID=UPI000066D52A|nr:hypothetical protein [Oceanicaulis sp. HTCC2633]EAP91340.1 hypothetical protein OA2633_04161 [Oceanicaulis sp. HTCC2633]
MSKPSYNFIDATFYFFKVFGARPLSVAWIAVWQIILYAAFAALILYGFWPLIDLVISYGGKGEPSDAEAIQAVMQGVGFYSLGTIGLLITALMMQGAWLRLLTRNEVAGGIPLRFGADELRLLLVNIVMGLLIFAGYIVTVLLYAAVNAGLMASGEGGGVALQALANTLLTIVLVVGWILFALGMAPAPGLTVRQRGVKIFQGFSAAGGVMGWMFLSYLVLILVAIIGYVVLSVIQQGFIMIGGAELIGALIQIEDGSDPEVFMNALMQALQNPLFWVMAGIAIVLQMIFEMFVHGCWHGVGAYVAVRHDGGFPPETPLEAPADSVGQAPSEG